MHDVGTSHSQLGAASNFGFVVEQLRPFPHLPLPLMYATAYTSNKTLASVSLGSIQFSSLDLSSQADLSLMVNQLAQRVDDQNNLVRHLLSTSAWSKTLARDPMVKRERQTYAPTCNSKGHI